MSRNVASLSDILAVNLIVDANDCAVTFELEPANKKTSGDSHRVPSGCETP